jgi:hypothetical protein
MGFHSVFDALFAKTFRKEACYRKSRTGRRSVQSGAYSAIGDGVLFQRDLLFQLCSGEPLLVIVVARTFGLYLGYPVQFSLHACVVVADDAGSMVECGSGILINANN